MAEIDNLEIRISAESQSAAQKVNALASSLDALGQSAETARHGVYNSAEAISSLSQVATTAAQAASKLSSLQNTLNSLGSLKAPDMSGFQTLARSLNTVASSMGAFANNRNIEKAVNGIKGIATAAITISSLNADTTKLATFFEQVNALDINESVISGLKQLQSASKNIVNAKQNENAADSLRLFLDTIRVITDDDLERLRVVSEAAKNIGSVKSPDLLGSSGEKDKNALFDKDIVNEVFPNIENAAEGIKTAFTGIWNVASGTLTKTAELIATVTQYAVKLGLALGNVAFAGTKLSAAFIFSPIKKIGSIFSNATKKASEFLSSIKRIAMYRVIRSAMKAISQGFQEGRENLYQYSVLINGDFAKSMDRAATAFLYLKNSIGAATAPLTNYLVPVIDNLIDKFVEFINYFNEMTAVLTGASTWTKAIKYPIKWQEAADDANKAAKKLKSTMLGFDELNVIEPNSTGRGSADDSGLDYSRMFTEVKVEMDLSDKMKSDVPAVLEPIVSAWESTGAETLDKIATSWKNIKELVGGVRDTFLEIWENGTGQRSMELLLETTGNIARAFGNVASSIKIAWDNAGAGKKVLQGIWNIANNIGTVFSRTWNDIANWAATLNFSPAIEALGGLFEAIEKLTDPDGALGRAFSNVWNKVLLPLGTWTIEEGVPAALDLVTLSIEGLTDAFEVIEPYLDKFVDFIAAVGGWTGDNIVGIANALKALRAINSGEDVDDETLSALVKADSTTSKLFDWNGDGSSWYDKYSRWMQKFTAGELGGSETDAQDLVDYEAGQALHREEMQKNWNAPTSIKSGFGGAWLAGIGSTNSEYDRIDSAEWDNSGKSGFFRDLGSAWLAGLGISDSELMSARASVAGSLSSGAVPTVINEITKPKSGNAKSGNGTQNLAMASGIDWNKAISTEDAQSAFKKVKGFFTDFSSNWTEGWNSMKKTVSEKWEGFKTDWGDGVDTIRTKWDGFKTTWSDGWETLKKTASDKWGAFKDNWTVGWDSIKKTASDKWSNFKSDWSSGVESIKQKWDEFKSAWSDGWNQIYLYAQKMVGKVVSVAMWIWQGSDGSGGIKKVVNSILSGIEGFFNFFVNGINFLINQLNDMLSFNVPDWMRTALEHAKGISIPATISVNIPTISAFSLPRLANGGIVDSGQMFIARESGAEFVGQYNNRTAVMNNDQIVEAVTAGVYRAVTTAMQNSDGGSQEVKVYLDGRQITAKTEEVKRDKGVSLLGGVVFA